jgi:hypothetical protein
MRSKIGREGIVLPPDVMRTRSKNADEHTVLPPDMIAIFVELLMSLDLISIFQSKTFEDFDINSRQENIYVEDIAISRNVRFSILFQPGMSV